MVVTAFIDVHVKMAENVILVMAIAFVCLVLLAVDANLYVRQVLLDLCAYKNVNVLEIMFVIHEQVIGK